MNPITLHIDGQNYVFRYIPAPSGFRYRLLWDPAEIGTVMPFYMAETVVRNSDQTPRVKVSWYDCHKFCANLNGLDFDDDKDNAAYCAASDKVAIRLPTEFEWEWAALGGENFEYAGCTNVDEVAWYHYEYEGNTGKIKEVGLKKPNGYGLYDMSGNVLEWTLNSQTFRGGSWNNSALDAQVANRGGYARGSNLGFRLCFSANPTALDRIRRLMR